MMYNYGVDRINYDHHKDYAEIFFIKGLKLRPVNEESIKIIQNYYMENGISLPSIEQKIKVAETSEVSLEVSLEVSIDFARHVCEKIDKEEYNDNNINYFKDLYKIAAEYTRNKYLNMENAS